MSDKQADAQIALRDGLNAWLDGADFAKALCALDAGASLGLPSQQGAPHSLLHSAAQAIFEPEFWVGLSVAVRKNMPHPDPLAMDGSTPLHFACDFGNVAAVQALLALGANPAAAGSNRLLPIHRACSMAHHDELSDHGACAAALAQALPPCVDCLVEPDPDRFLNPTSQDLLDPESLRVGSPIHFACRNSAHGALAALAEAGADLQAIEPISGSRPIDIAMRSGSERFAISLIQLGCPCECYPSSRPGVGSAYSPLRVALGNGWIDAAQSLLGAGASLLTPSSGFPNGQPLADIEPESVARGLALPFWRGYLNMFKDEMAIRKAIGERHESLARIGKRSMRM